MPLKISSLSELKLIPRFTPSCLMPQQQVVDQEPQVVPDMPGSDAILLYCSIGTDIQTAKTVMQSHINGLEKPIRADEEEQAALMANKKSFLGTAMCAYRRQGAPTALLQQNGLTNHAHVV